MDDRQTDTGFYGIENHGFKNVGKVFKNLTTPHLYEEIVRRREGSITHLGPIVVRTGNHTGRSPDDKFIVKEPSSEKKIWWGKVNRPFSREKFDFIYSRLLAYLQGKDVFVQDCFAGTDPAYRTPIRVITEDAWHSLFARNMFVQIRKSDLKTVHIPDFTVVNVPKFHAVPELDHTHSEAFVLVHFGRKLVLIGGTIYAGEIKKAVFTAMNYFLPEKKVFPMHCSANVGQKGDVAIFFGLSGTGKTTLSASPDRGLIGDDE
ncbi:MAG: phosphoenolpyruvate carboxykinase (ATP), partial [Nitrospinota bacterium]